MALAIDTPPELEMNSSKAFNPLQSSHSHMYTSHTKQTRGGSKERGEKLRTRSSRQLPPNLQVDNSNVLKRRTSRLGVFGLFKRSKTPDPETRKLEMQDEEREEPAQRQESVASNASGQAYTSHSYFDKDLQDKDLHVASNTSDHAYTSNLHVDNGHHSEPLGQKTSKRALKTKDSFTKPKSAVTWPAIWEPPPLFQAYPQAIKFATLSSLTLPADAILRLNNDRQRTNTKQAASAGGSGSSKKAKDKRFRKSLAPDLLPNDWIDKIYVLVTEGYLLQYAGHGKYDRSPEKILPLNSQSAAFASDAIPGKPFVLQVSQICDDIGTVDSGKSRDMLKKAGLNVEVKRSASSFLLVLTSPGEMDAWLVAVRKEIEALGGQEYKAEVFGTDGMETADDIEKPALEIHRMPSQRYLVKRQPHRFSQMPPQAISPSDEPLAGRPESLAHTHEESRNSTVSPYISDTTASIDQIHLDKLRESPRRSYISSSAKTASTSRCSSTDRSPVLEGFVDAPKNRASYSGSASVTHLMHNIIVPSDLGDRELDQATPTPPSPRKLSVSSTALRTGSPPAPNFSVPIFSKRFSGMSYSSIPSARTATPIAQADSSVNNSPELVVRSQTPVAQEDIMTNSSSRIANGTSPTIAQAGIHPALGDATSHVERVRERDSFLGEMQYRPTSHSRISKRISVAADSSRLSTPHKSSDSKNSPSFLEGEPQFSRRHSSLTYAQGISPVPLPGQSPSPHPPPTLALPPVPKNPDWKRVSSIPPPTGPLPPLPIKAHSEGSTISQTLQSTSSRNVLPKPPAFELLPPSFPADRNAETNPTHKLRRPISMQVRVKSGTRPDLQRVQGSRAQMEPIEDNSVKNSPSSSLPNRQVEQTTGNPAEKSRSPPSPSFPRSATALRMPSPPRSLARKSMPRLGSPPPPVSPPRVVIPPSPFLPEHPFIPPIELMSLDGPWNAEFNAPKRTYLDLSVG